MATRAERGKCVLTKDNLNVRGLITFEERGMANSDHISGVIEQVAYDHWQIAHDEFCPFGSGSHPEHHPDNPYTEES